MANSLFIASCALVGVSSSVPLPTTPQLRYQHQELVATIGFQMDTYALDNGDPGCNAGNWNDKMKTSQPSAFNPTDLNMSQWAEVLKSYGAKSAWVNAKHGCGFLMWPTKTKLPNGKPYGYDVSNAPAVAGRDLVGEFFAAMRKADILPGVYYSLKDNFYLNVPANAEVSTDRPLLPGMANVTQAEFEALVVAQLRELWSNYGFIFEEWFDGGFSAGLHNIKQTVVDMVNDLIHETVAFAGATISSNGLKWAGSEAGIFKPGIWSNTESTADSGTGNPGNPHGQYFIPSGCDTVIVWPPRWFWVPGITVKTLEQLITNYHDTVGNNCVLELGFVALPSGLIPDDQVTRAREFGDWIRNCYDKPVVETNGTAQTNATFVINLMIPAGSPAIDRVVIREDLAQGQRVLKYEVQAEVGGKWQPFSNGTAVGNKRIDIVDAPIKPTSLRLTIVDALEAPVISSFGAFAPCPKK